MPAVPEIVEINGRIEELQQTHHRHITKLQALHEFEVADLKSQLEGLKNEVSELEKYEEEQSLEMAETKREFLKLQESFELMQEQLKKSLLSQDNVIEMIRAASRVESPTVSLTMAALAVPGSSDPKPFAQVAKYLEKLEASEPARLCRLLDISFTPERAFSLSNTLLAGVLVHMKDSKAAEGTEQLNSGELALMTQIIELRRTLNDLTQAHLELLKAVGLGSVVMERLQAKDQAQTSLAEIFIDFAHEDRQQKDSINQDDSGMLNQILYSFFSHFSTK